MRERRPDLELMTRGTPTAEAMRERLRAGWLSVGVSLVLLAAKVYAYRITHSTAILSDALETIVNVVAAMFALYSIVVSARPADRDHPYGHGKVEDFSAGVEGALICAAGGMILWEAVPRLFDPQPLMRLDTGIAIVVAAGLVNAWLGLHLLRLGRRTTSAALVADGKHLLTDAWTSAALIVGLVGVRLTGWLWLDPALACALALNILWAGGRIIRQSVGNLMDEADPELVGRVVDSLVEVRRPGLLEPHQLRVRRLGAYHHIDLHLVLPRFWTVERAHELEEELAGSLLHGIGEAGEIILHTDPCLPAHCSGCDLEPCPVRSSDFAAQRAWTVESVTGPPVLSPGDV